MHRIALASSTGLMVDEHFARCGRFVIVDAQDGGWRTVETRLVPPANAAGTHNRGDFERAADLLADCDGLFVAKIGPYAAELLLQRGLRVFEAPYAVEFLLQKLQADGMLTE